MKMNLTKDQVRYGYWKWSPESGWPPKTRFLTLINTRLTDKSFDPILNLMNLERFDSSWNYPESEFEKLKSLPNLRYGNVENIQRLTDYFRA
jgi:hypothetical protein